MEAALKLWAVVFAVGALNYFSRLSFIAFFAKRSIPPLLARALFPGDADPVVERALPRAPRDSLHALDRCRVHRFAALIARGDEREVVVERAPFAREIGSQCRFVTACEPRFQQRDLGVTLQDLESHPHLVDAVVERFELRRLVDDVFRRRHLAAVVQPARDVHGLPIIFGQTEIPEGPVACIACRLRQ